MWPAQQVLLQLPRAGADPSSRTRRGPWWRHHHHTGGMACTKKQRTTACLYLLFVFSSLLHRDCLSHWGRYICTSAHHTGVQNLLAGLPHTARGGMSGGVRVEVPRVIAKCLWCGVARRFVAVWVGADDVAACVAVQAEPLPATEVLCRVCMGLQVVMLYSVASLCFIVLVGVCRHGMGMRVCGDSFQQLSDCMRTPR